MFMSMGANSLINPVVYATLVYKIPEFRAGMIRIFHKAPNHIRPADLPVGNLQADFRSLRPELHDRWHFPRL